MPLAHIGTIMHDAVNYIKCVHRITVAIVFGITSCRRINTHKDAPYEHNAAA
jgi:hypothetical protein